MSIHCPGGSDGPSWPNHPSWPARSALLRGQQSPGETSAKGMKHPMAASPSKPLVPDSTAGSKGCSSHACTCCPCSPSHAHGDAPVMPCYPQQGMRSTSCSRTMGSPPSLEPLMHPQVSPRQKKNQQQDLVLALAHSTPWGPANRGSNSNS